MYQIINNKTGERLESYSSYHLADRTVRDYEVADHYNNEYEENKYSIIHEEDSICVTK